jgi:hypothetical protein
MDKESPDADLTARAERRFGSLSEAERKVLAAAGLFRPTEFLLDSWLVYDYIPLHVHDPLNRPGRPPPPPHRGGEGGVRHGRAPAGAARRADGAVVLDTDAADAQGDRGGGEAVRGDDGAVAGAAGGVPGGETDRTERAGGARTAGGDGGEGQRRFGAAAADDASRAGECARGENTTPSRFACPSPRINPRIKSGGGGKPAAERRGEGGVADRVYETGAPAPGFL